MDRDRFREGLAYLKNVTYWHVIEMATNKVKS